VNCPGLNCQFTTPNEVLLRRFGNCGGRCYRLLVVGEIQAIGMPGYNHKLRIFILAIADRMQLPGLIIRFVGNGDGKGVGVFIGIIDIVAEDYQFR